MGGRHIVKGSVPSSEDVLPGFCEGFSYSPESGIFLPKKIAASPSATKLDLGSHFEIRCSIYPSSGEGVGGQFKDCLSQISRILTAQGVDRKNIVQFTVFLPSDGFLWNREAAASVLGDFLHESGFIPPTSFIGQTPSHGKMTCLESVILTPKENISLKIRHEHIPQVDVDYSAAEVGGHRWMWGGGLEGHGPDTKTSCVRAFSLLADVLAREGMSFQHIVSQKNYVDSICHRNYNDFNVVRAAAYRRGGLVDGFPSATGIGTVTGVPGHFVMEFVAYDGVREPLDNDWQRPAHKYDREWLEQQARGVGASIGGSLSSSTGLSVDTPKFSRGLYLPESGVFLVSGTASIIGTKIQHTMDEPKEMRIDDLADAFVGRGVGGSGFEVVADAGGRFVVQTTSAVEAQTWQTLKIINHLLAQRDMSVADIRQLRVYVKHIGDVNRVSEICRKVLGDVPTICVNGSVCYEDMLVELEGLAKK